MILEMENGVRLENVMKSDLECLRKIDGSSNSFAFIENENGSYIQVGGGPLEFTVESRRYFPDGTFIHQKAKQKELSNLGTKLILISGAVVEVQINHIMKLEEVILLFHSFWEGEYFSEAVGWDDITNMFG